MRELPRGTVTFLFTDIEGSTRLLQELGDGYADALAEHRRLLRESFERHGGVEVDTQGDAFFIAFAEAAKAVSAAAEGQDVLEVGPVRVRIGIHTGEPAVTDEGYVGLDVHRAARICAAAHGGQIVLSESTEALLGDGFPLQDLGVHRLKDLREAAKLFQVGAGEFPPLRSLNATNLPTQPTALVGRERELAEVLELLRSARLVTLTGAGGSGKTRLALQAAAELVGEFKDGVFWVSLAALSDPELVLPTVAATVGAKNDLADHVDEKRMLLLLDNLEQILGCAPALGGLLRSCPNLNLLVTSRAPLRMGGEQEYEMPPLPEAEAVELFTQRARQVRSDFEPDEHVAEICRRLDGLPLALELAAARVKLLSPEQILERFGPSLDLLTTGARDLPERQRTLRATIEWSYELLAAAEKRLFASLAVFAGSFDLEGAEEVCGATLDSLSSLIDQSLLRRTAEGRFFMLETIREFAGEQLEERPDAEELRGRHADRLLRSAEAAGGSFWHTDDPVLLAGLALEEDNLRAALGWALEVDPPLAARLAANLTRYWFVHGAHREGALWCDAAVAKVADAAADVRAPVLIGASEFARFRHDYPRAIALKEEAIRLLREIGDESRLAATMKDLGEIAIMQGEWGRAEQLIDESLAIRRRLGSSGGIAHSLHGQGELALAREDWTRARSALTEALELFRAAGDEWEVGVVTHSLAERERRSGEPDRAAAVYVEAIGIGIRLDAPQLVAECLEGLAGVAAQRHDWSGAARLAGAAEEMLKQAGAMIAYPSEHDKLVAALRTALSRDELESTWSSGRAMTTENAVEYAKRAARRSASPSSP
ncbi:MAG TPA: tetratricopeptide repeat protein [Gaiellaceae bacterium]|jgi:predicted ATPase/class 3 adenylate cyclase